MDYCNCANLGCYYFRELIKLSYFNNLYEENYKNLCLMLGKKMNVDVKKIESNIYNLINSANINLTKKNFEDVFHIEFDYFYMLPKKLTVLFLNLLNSNFN